MQALIFCGGFGTRINKGLKLKKLKPLIKINKKEILLRIIEIYKKNGINDFILLGGYKIDELKKFSKKVKDVNIQVLDTGLKTETGGRLLRAKKLIKNDNFLLTYGDSLASFNLKKAFKKKKKSNFIFSAFKYFIPYGVFGHTKQQIDKIYEKNYSVLINAGFYMLDKRVFNFIKNDEDSFENKIIPKIIKSKKIIIKYTLANMWYPMDTIKDKKNLENKLK
jgi:glucose-1-phosphate cytidylyltransferase